MKDKRRKMSDCVATNVTCVTWNLPGIPCLGIQTGDTMDEVTFAIVEKICALGINDDLENIELQCLIDKLDITVPAQKTVSTFLQLAFDNDCALFDLIKDVKDLINTPNIPLVLDLKCLAQFDSFGNQLPYTAQSVLQSLITQGCGFVSQIAGLSGAITTTNIRIDNITPYTEPSLTSCLFSGPKTLSQATVILASDYCSFRAKVGTIASIESAIGNQTPILADPLFPISDLLALPVSLSDSDFNQWEFISNLYKRLLDLEACACRAKCSDIKIGWNVIDQEDGKSIVIDFSGDYGNYIPIDYQLQSDSTVTFIDINKKPKSYPLPTGTGIFKTEYESVPYDISMLDLSGMMVIKVCVKLLNTKTGEICCKCEESEHFFVGGCSYCELTSTSGDVTVIYENCTYIGKSQVCKTVSKIISEGKTEIFKKTDNIIFIDPIENVTGVECLNYTPATLKCYIAAMGIKAKGDNQTDYFEQSSQRITGFKYNGVEYNFTNSYYVNKSITIPGYPFPFQAYDTEAILKELKSKVGGILASSSRTFYFGTNTTASFQIKTTEALAKSLYLIVQADAPSGSSTNAPIVFVYLPFYEYGTKYPNANFPVDYTSLCGGAGT